MAKIHVEETGNQGRESGILGGQSAQDEPQLNGFPGTQADKYGFMVGSQQSTEPL